MLFVRGKLEVSCFSKLMAFKLGNTSAKRNVCFSGMLMVSFLILRLKCNLIFVELFVFSSFEAYWNLLFELVWNFNVHVL